MDKTSTNASIHVSLDQADFHTLISGGVVEKPGVRIILSDIGYGVMIKTLSDHMLTVAGHVNARN